MASLVVMGPPGREVSYTLPVARGVVIGRSGFCDIVLNKRSLSREHARVVEVNGQHFISDLGSVNGTFVNGRPVREPTLLKDGDRINLFDLPLTYCARNEVLSGSNAEMAVTNGEMATITSSELAITNGEMTNSSNSSTRMESLRVAESSSERLKERLNSLLEIAHRLGSHLAVDEILPKVLDALFLAFPQATNGEIVLLDESGALIPRASKHGRKGDSSVLTAFPINEPLTQRVIKTGTGLVDHRGDDQGTSALEDRFDSSLCVPIVAPGRVVLGAIMLETDDPAGKFVDDDLQLVDGVAVMTAQAIGYARAHELILEHDRHRHQMEMARDIQIRKLPRMRPEVPGYSFGDYYRAADTVGGDWYTYRATSNGRMVIAVADASGKGLVAALKIVDFASELRHCLETTTSLKRAMSRLNQFVCEFDEGFITFCVGVLDPREHRLSIANAGHPAPLLRRSDGSIEALGADRSGMPLGLDPQEQYHPYSLDVSPGDEFVMYTDGVTEALNRSDELFGTARLLKILAAPAPDVEGRVRAIVKRVEQFRGGRSPSDDTCVVAFSRISV